MLNESVYIGTSLLVKSSFGELRLAKSIFLPTLTTQLLEGQVEPLLSGDPRLNSSSILRNL